MRGGPGRGGYGGMPNADSLMMNSPDPSYPPNEGNDTQVWAKMVEIMQNMGVGGLLTTPQTNQPTRSMWQNPYNMYGGNYQNYGGYPRNNNGDSALARVVSDLDQRAVVMSDMLDRSTSNYIASNFNLNFNAFGDSSHTTPI
jgi:hypothetical protein